MPVAAMRAIDFQLSVLSVKLLTSPPPITLGIPAPKTQSNKLNWFRIAWYHNYSGHPFGKTTQLSYYFPGNKNPDPDRRSPPPRTPFQNEQLVRACGNINSMQLLCVWVRALLYNTASEWMAERMWVWCAQRRRIRSVCVCTIKSKRYAASCCPHSYNAHSHPDAATVAGGWIN